MTSKKDVRENSDKRRDSRSLGNQRLFASEKWTKDLDLAATDAIVVPPGGGVTINSQSEGALPRGFAFLANVSAIIGADELELFPGHTLRRAQSDEIEFIKNVLVENNGRPIRNYFFPWELDKREDGLLDTAPKEKWNYFVVAFTGTNEGIIRLQRALVILDPCLKIGFTILDVNSTRGLILHPGQLFQTLQQAKDATLQLRLAEFLCAVDARRAEEIATVVEQLSAHQTSQIDIVRTCDQLLNLETLQPESDVAFLGYFSILESLLTHKPDPRDPNDSITRQVKKKITLLDNRWTPRIDYASFGSSDPETIWGKMYALRSAIAHGDAPDFKRELKALNSLSSASLLLRRTVRAIARHALREPQLVSDLREC